MNKLNVTVSLRVFSITQYSIIAFLLLASTAGYLLRHYTVHDFVWGLVPIFDVALESSIPTFFSTINLLLAAILLSLIVGFTRQEGGPLVRYWVMLAILFLYLSVDEAAQVHEKFARVSEKIGSAFPVFGSHTWLPIGIAIACVVGGIFLPFLSKLPRRTALRFVVAGTIFISGAIGLEFVGALMVYTEYAVRGDLVYELRRIGEEGFEMLGIAYFNCTLLGELKAKRLLLNFD